MGRIFFFITLGLIICRIVWGQELNLSGIMNGSRPNAIINDQIVAVGDTVDGWRVVEIGADYVVCEGKTGRMNLRLKESATPQVYAQPTAKVVANRPAPKPPSAPVGETTDGPLDVEARKHMDKSLDYLKQGDALLKSPLAFERLYAKAAELCDAADREAQIAFRSVSGDALREGIKTHIDKVRKAKESILKEKANFNTRVRSLISEHEIVTGMTQQDIHSSWGPPLMQNHDGDVEKWVYQDNNGYQKKLVFKDEILVSF